MRVHTILTVIHLLSEGLPGVVLGKKVYTVTEGENFTAKCQFYFSGSKKIFCKNNCENKEDTLVETEGNTGANDRYSIKYEEKTKKMSVSIKKVQMSDAGGYWCWLDRWIKNGYQEFKIEVNKVPLTVKSSALVDPPVSTTKTTKTTTTITATTTVRPTHSPGLDLDPSPGSAPGSGETSGSSAPLPVDSHASTATGPLLYVGLTLALTVVLFTVPLLILYKKKKNKLKAVSFNAEPAAPEVDREYVEVPEQQVQSRSTDGSDIYSLASAPARAQVDTVLYSKVKFHGTSAPRSPMEAVLYSTVRTEEALYSNVSKRQQSIIYDIITV